MPARTRLSPSIFQLPVEKMRDGYYSDTYFNRANEILIADNYFPRVRKFGTYFRMACVSIF